MKKSQHLPERIKKVWKISALLSLVVGSVMCAVIYWVVDHFDWPGWINYIAWTLVLLDFVVELLIIPYRYRFWLYQITTTDVEIESGFFLHKQTAIPISRIQNVTLQAGPLFQLFHLQSVKIETAAAAHEIAGVLPESAVQLKQRLMELTQEEDVNAS